VRPHRGGDQDRQGGNEVRGGPIAPHLDVLPCNDTIVDIWASNILRDDRNRVDARRSSAYYVAKGHNNRC